MSQKRQNSEDIANQEKKLKQEEKMEGTSMHDEEPGSEYVAMPWDDNTKIYFSEADSQGETVTRVITRWELIKVQMNSNKPIFDVEMLIDVIRSYNVIFDKDGKQVKPPWKCRMLCHFFNTMDDDERNEFFKENGLLSTIRNLAQQLPSSVSEIRLLKSGCRLSVSLHQMQIACLLANAFMCTYPMRDGNYPSINFNMLYEGSPNSIPQFYIEKIKCIVHYFKRIGERQSTGIVSFHRLCIHDQKLPRWDKTTANLCNLEVQTHGRIEEQEGFLQMDFANRYVGGGVLKGGCVQEEIRFIICPELIISRLFTECLADNEALLIIGAERYSNYRGYSDSFEFDGDYQDTTPFDETRHRKSHVIALDALFFRHPADQYRESRILRELKKAYVGFRPFHEDVRLPLATGNWGCGAFRGDPQLKSILQLMASSQARRDMLYITFGDDSLKSQIESLYRLLKEQDVNVGKLYRIIRLYNKEKRKNQTVFEFVKEAVLGRQLDPNPPNTSIAHLLRKEPSKKPEPKGDCGFSEEPDFASAEKAVIESIRNDIAKCSKSKSLDKRSVALDMDFANLEKKIKRHSVCDTKNNSQEMYKEEEQLLRKYTTRPDASEDFDNHLSDDEESETHRANSEVEGVSSQGSQDLFRDVNLDETLKLAASDAEGAEIASSKIPSARPASPSLFSDSESPSLAPTEFKDDKKNFATDVNSPDLFSDGEEFATASEKCTSSEKIKENMDFIQSSRTFVRDVRSSPVLGGRAKKLHQTKITDCFFKQS